ncbi:hypothetical protein [Shewanella chilikensis]|uniref:hypothetical protein n=1 Tax=Shewanella chilikensis TaxID=558541 RepID=UPI001F17182A|nr:hypothetical protein [Shewanella chilikensis]MCE9786151.1 hypothetical protein [Shewanella chilikensis]
MLYAYFHVFNRYDVLDINLTIRNSESPAIDAIRTPVLDPAKLTAIPLEQRLLFKLDQAPLLPAGTQQRNEQADRGQLERYLGALKRITFSRAIRGQVSTYSRATFVSLNAKKETGT